MIRCRRILWASVAFSFVLLARASGNDNWPQWRGPQFNGTAKSDAPVRWSDTENVKWKIEIPGRGYSTPVVWENKLFLTTAVPTGKAPEPPAQPEAAAAPRQGGRGGPGDAGPQVEHRFEVICLDKNSGKILWQKTAKVAVPHEGFHRTYGSFASNSPATDGRRLYAFFGSRGLFCYDLNGRLLWEKDFGISMKMRLQFGEGIAPVLHGDALILNFDHEAGSVIVAVNKENGNELWKANRDDGSSWSTPLVIDHGGKTQVIVAASNKVRSYDLKTGTLIWECAGLGSNVIPAPVYDGERVYVMSGHRNPKLLAIRLGKEGDLTGTDAVIWTQTRGLSYTASPVLQDGKLFMVTDQGMVSCFNAVTGEPYYHQVRLPKGYSFKASPVAAAGKLYLATEEEDVVVLKMGEQYEVLATNSLVDQGYIASPVIVGGDIFLRSRTHLFCISQKR